MSKQIEISNKLAPQSEVQERTVDRYSDWESISGKRAWYFIGP